MSNHSERQLVTGEIYHIFSKSIAGFVIFNDQSEFSRIIDTMKYYKVENPPTKFSYFMNRSKDDNFFWNLNEADSLVNILAYCIMPTHVHLILKQIKDKGISIFMNNILNSHTRYFNTKHNRKGPLWESRFKRVVVKTDEQLLHLTRYVHLNPTTSFLVSRPEDWHASSYGEYLSKSIAVKNDKLCDYEEILKIDSEEYKKFVDERICYQRELAKIKHLFIE